MFDMHLKTAMIVHRGCMAAALSVCELCCVYLQATELRLAGNAEARGGDLRRAVELYTQVQIYKQHPSAALQALPREAR